MKSNTYISNLLRNKTFLDEDSINQIIESSKSMDIIADFTDCDIFIDVPSRDKNKAIVAFHAMPKNVDSIYIDNVSGEEALRENEPGVLKTLETGLPCRDIKAITQESKIVKQKIKPISNSRNEIIGVMISEKDISNEVEEDFRLGNGNKQLLSLFESNGLNGVLANNLNESVLIFDKKGRLVIKNNKAANTYKMIGFFEEIDYMSYNNISIDKRKFKDIIREVEVKKKMEREISFGDYYFNITWIYIENNHEISLVCLMEDITYMKIKQKEMELKEIQIKEAHHRIKNNLQSTASLLRRKSRRVENIGSKDLLEDSISNILTIASTHDLLSKTDNNKIFVKEVICGIVKNIDSLEDKKIKINVIGDDFEIDGKKGTTLLLVINEMVINCYKHGFKEKNEGILNIILKDKQGYITIKIINNGVMYNFDNKDKHGLGMEIINMYVEEVLKGKINIKVNEEFTELTIKFKLDK